MATLVKQKYYNPMKIRLLSVLFLTTICPYIASALPVLDLYRVTLPVTNQSEVERQQALKLAFRQVLIKVNGNIAVLKPTAISTSFTHVKDYVQSYTYVPLSQGKLGLTVTFDDKAVTRLLTGASQTIWRNDRPAVLALIALQTVQANSLLNNNQNNAITQNVRLQASNYGIPLLLPVAEATDFQGLTFADVWQANIVRISQAAARYQSDAILIGKICQNGEQWQARWTLVENGNQASWTSRGNALDPVLNLGISLSAQALAARYATSPSSALEKNQSATLNHITFIVSNVNNLSTYAKLTNYLHQIALIKEVNIIHVGTHEVEFKLALASDKAELEKTFALQHQLKPAFDSSRRNNSTELHYQWSS